MIRVARAQSKSAIEPEVDRCRMFIDPVAEALAPARLIRESGLQLCQSSVNQIKADVITRRCARAATSACQLDRMPSHLDLIDMRSSGDRLDHAAVTVAGLEVLMAVNPRRDPRGESLPPDCSARKKNSSRSRRGAAG